MNTIQFIAVEPEQLQEGIKAAVQLQLELFFEDFQEKQNDELLTREETAQLLKVNISTINNWRKSGKLISYGLGNRVYFRRMEIDKALLPLNNCDTNV